MTAMVAGHILTSISELEERYGEPVARSVFKETAALNPAYAALIAASPFLAIASSSPEGLDCSPRGDAAGWVRVHDAHTLMLPDRRGNNRIDTLRNIIRDPRVGLLFLIPGAGESLRVNGTAVISIEPSLLASFAVGGHEPRSVIVVTITSVYFQCARAILRSGLWNPANHADLASLPSAGAMTAEAGGSQAAGFDQAAYDAELPARQRATLY
jgi:uncharacterized protein